MRVDATNARVHNKRLQELIQSRMEESLPRVAEAMALDAASRAPSLDEEYRELNAEAGEEALVPRSGDSSADSDGRVRFQKTESTYLLNAVRNSQNVAFNGPSLRTVIGNVDFLRSQTYFTYTNIGSHGGTIDHTVGPYFSMFEGGTAGAAVNEGGTTTFIVEPHSPRADGSTYPLRPGEGDDGKRVVMTKSITGRAMFMPLYLQRAASTVLRTALAEIGPSVAT